MEIKEVSGVWAHIYFLSIKQLNKKLERFVFA